MTPEQYQQINRLLDDALERPPNERAAVLAAACGEDEELRREAESLLAACVEAGSFIERLPMPLAAELIAEHSSAPGAAEPMTGRTLGRYRLGALLGAGGMGQVYRARDLRLDRDVAIKILPAHLADNAEALRRFEREARAVAALSHPNILAIFDFGTEAGVSYAVTELLEGETLRARLTRAALSWREAVEISIAVAEGLAAAHAKGIIHRDLKPENIFLTGDGGVKILDFGIARVKRAVTPDAETIISTTTPGVVMGTLGYMSPEQVRGEAADAPSDIFSLGCVLYELVSGRRPFAGATVTETIAAILRDDPPPLSRLRSALPRWLELVIRRCLDKRPERRPQAARDLAFELRSLLGDGTAATTRLERRQHLAWWAALGLVMLAGALALYLRWNHAIRPAQVVPAPSSATQAALSPRGAEVLRYYLELETADEGRRVTGMEALPTGQLFKFHFIPRARGCLYIVAPSANNAPTTFLTQRPDVDSGVMTNQVEAGVDFSFPSGSGNWLELGRHGNSTSFTIIFAPTPLTEPGFLAAPAYRQLTEVEQQELGALWQQFGAVTLELTPITDGAQMSVAVTLPANYNAAKPVIFDIPIKRR